MQIKELDSDSSVHGIGKRENKSTNKKTPPDNEEKRHSGKEYNCCNCGTRHGARECPAYGKTSLRTATEPAVRPAVKILVS